MKSLDKSLLALSIASLSLVAADIHAQTTDDVRLGYCTTDYSQGLIARDLTGSHVYQAATYITSDMLNKYVGCQIDAVEFAIKPMRGTMATVFVCTDLDDLKSTTLSSATTRNYSEGWNKVALKTPVTITKGMNLYIGYMLMLSDGETYDCLLFDKSPYALKGHSWYGYDDVWMNNTEGINHNICVRAVASGDNVPEGDISLMKFEPADGSDYVNQNSPKSYYAYVQNNGRQKVTSLNLSLTSATSQGAKTIDIPFDNLDIPNNEPTKILLDNIVTPVEGNFTTTFCVTQVNGAADPDPSDNSATRSGYSIKEGTSPVARRILFEEFTSEGYEESPAADEMHREVIGTREALDDVVWVKHHRNYGSAVDQFALSGDANYSELYGSSRPFVPAVCFDRLTISGMEDSGPAYYIPYSEQVATFFDLAAGQPSFVSLKAVPTLSADGAKLSVDVSGHAGTNEMPMQTDLRLTAWLVEDNIASTTQAGATNYVQNGVLRKVLSDVWGDNLDISSYDFEKTFSAELDPSWNKNNLRVVAFVSNYDNDTSLRRVYNTAEASISTESAIESVTPASHQPFSLIDGRIVANEGFTLQGIYDVAGRNVANGNLSTGLYIVKATNGTHVYTQKINVKR